jgi:hypothetical protein
MIPFLDTAIELSLGRLVDTIETALGEAHNNHNSRTRVKSALAHHYQTTKVWAETLPVVEYFAERSTEISYVDLHLSLFASYGAEETTVYTIDSLYDLSYNLLILGEPGAGKTTALRRFWIKCASDMARPLPLVIPLRGLESGESLLDHLIETIGIDTDSEEAAAISRQDKRRTLVRYLAAAGLIVLFDGLDEADSANFENYCDEIKHLCQHARDFRVIVTCRTAAATMRLPRTKYVIVQPLSDEQQKVFVRAWLPNEKSAQDIEREFLRVGVIDSRPLILGWLCTIFLADGQLPPHPRLIYRRILQILARKWDEERLVSRGSSVARFGSGAKLEFLEHLAFTLSTLFNGTQFGTEAITLAFGRICKSYGMDIGDAQHVAREVEIHTGIIRSIGFDRFEFMHKTVQEFLFASYVVKHEDSPLNYEIVVNRPDELAVATAIHPDPSLFLSRLVREVLCVGPISHDFVVRFVGRLAAEKPSFSTSTALGKALVFLASKPVGPPGGRAVNTNLVRGTKSAHVDAVVHAFEQLFEDPVALDAFQSVSTDFTIGSRSSRTTLQPKRTGRAIPEFPDRVTIPRALADLMLANHS